jgi:hypothetical protein
LSDQGDRLGRMTDERQTGAKPVARRIVTSTAAEEKRNSLQTVLTTDIQTLVGAVKEVGIGVAIGLTLKGNDGGGASAPPPADKSQ